MNTKLESLKCPDCGASIDMDIKNRKAVFCPFCGSQFAINDDTININQNIKYTDEAAVERERRKDREHARDNKLIIIMFIILIAIGAFCSLSLFLSEYDPDAKKPVPDGMIRVGKSSDDMWGKSYTGIEEYLENVGFTNITTVDLDDADWIINKEDKVASVTIDGNSDFKASKCFDPDAQVIISYH